MILVFWHRQHLMQSIIFHLYFGQSWPIVQHVLSATSEILVLKSLWAFHHLKLALLMMMMISTSTAVSMIPAYAMRARSKYFGDVYTPVHTIAARSGLWSADHGDLVVPHMWSTRFGSRSFRVCGPTIWNKLPQDLRSTDTREQFKCSLKRWLFKCAYGRRRVW